MKTRWHFAVGAAAGFCLLAAASGCRNIAEWTEFFSGKANTMKINGITLRIDHLDHNDYNDRYKYPGRMDGVKYVTIHNTWNFAPACDERNYLNNRRDHEYISFQYAVDETEAVEIMAPGERAWHAGDGSGDGNAHSIGVEICRSRCVDAEEGLYRRAEANAVRLAAWLLYRYHLPATALRKHQDWNGKHCPHRILDEGRWEEFKAAVAASLRQLEADADSRYRK